MYNVAIVRSNSIFYDPRVRKIGRSLYKKYSLLILGWNREGLSKEKIDNFFADLKLFNLRAPFGRRTLLLYLPSFWIWIFYMLMKYRPTVVHACDFDLVLPCYIYKLLFKKKLIFDVFDRYAMTYVEPKHKRLYSFVNFLEEIFSKRSDVLVNVSESLLGTFKRRPSRCAIIMNCAEEYNIKRVRPITGKLQIFHSGGIRHTRGLEQITAAMKDLDNVELLIAGRVINEDLKHKILELPNVIYKGLLSQDEVLIMEGQSDVSVALYDPKDPINEYSVGNKLFESMMLGLPIVTNTASEIITDVGNGIVVDYDNVEQIREAIITLRDNASLREQLGNNARDAFLKKYNWTAMEQELYRLYDALLEN